MMNVNIINALVQTQVPDDLRGRVMSIYTLTFLGFMPIGSLWVGIIAAQVGEPTAAVLSASMLLGFATLVWARMPRLRALE
jgi:hypothetical protein